MRDMLTVEQILKQWRFNAQMDGECTVNQVDWTSKVGRETLRKLHKQCKNNERGSGDNFASAATQAVIPLLDMLDSLEVDNRKMASEIQEWLEKTWDDRVLIGDQADEIERLKKVSPEEIVFKIDRSSERGLQTLLVHAEADLENMTSEPEAYSQQEIQDYRGALGIIKTIFTRM